MPKIRKNISITKMTDRTIKQIAKRDKRTESAVIELAIEAYVEKLAAEDLAAKDSRVG